MNKLTAVSVFSAALVFAGAALAQDVAPKSRADVVAELQQARASGELDRMHSEVGVDGYQVVNNRPAAAVIAAKPVAAKAVTTASAGKSRAEVVAELQRARETGELDALQSEIGVGYFPTARRLPVQGEVRSAE